MKAFLILLHKVDIILVLYFKEVSIGSIVKYLVKSHSTRVIQELISVIQLNNILNTCVILLYHQPNLKMYAIQSFLQTFATMPVLWLLSNQRIKGKRPWTRHTVVYKSQYLHMCLLQALPSMIFFTVKLYTQFQNESAPSPVQI